MLNTASEKVGLPSSEPGERDVRVADEGTQDPSHLRPTKPKTMSHKRKIVLTCRPGTGRRPVNRAWDFRVWFRIVSATFSDAETLQRLQEEQLSEKTCHRENHHVEEDHERITVVLTEKKATIGPIEQSTATLTPNVATSKRSKDENVSREPTIALNT